jgi:hypothetical protein
MYAPMKRSLLGPTNHAKFSDYLPYSSDLNQFEMSQDRYCSSLLTHASQPTSPFEHRDFTTIIEGDKRRRKSPNTPDLTEKPMREVRL